AAGDAAGEDLSVRLRRYCQAVRAGGAEGGGYLSIEAKREVHAAGRHQAAIFQRFEQWSARVMRRRRGLALDWHLRLSFGKSRSERARPFMRPRAARRDLTRQ